MAEKRLLKDPSTGTAYLVESLRLWYFFDKAAACYPVVWDYQTIHEPISSGRWEPRYTYWVSSTIYIESTLTICPGTTVKLNPYTSIDIVTGGKILAKGHPYNYITFTKAEDDNCGEPIVNAPPGHSDTAIDIASDASWSCAIQYCKIAHANTGLRVRRSLAAPIAHNIVRDTCTYGLRLENCTTDCHNNLIANSGGYGIYCSYLSYSDLTNNTIDNCSYGILSYAASNVNAYDSLFTNAYYGVYSYGDGGGMYVDHCAFFNIPPEDQIVGADEGDNISIDDPYDHDSTFGDYYLSDYGVGVLGNAGHTQASDAAVGLASEVFTLRAPDEVAVSEYKAPVTWSKITYKDGTPDEGLVAIGYHHSRTDR